MTPKQKEVAKQLAHAELQAFGGLLMGPLLGAMLLNYVRNTMARPANGLITNFNITVFVLAAELRPLKIAFQYLDNRSERLQRDLTDVAPARYDELMEKVNRIEMRLIENDRMQSHRGQHSDQIFHSVSASSPDGSQDLEQIKHALRRFERHEAQLQQQYEEKLYSIERKLADMGGQARHVQSHGSPLARAVTSIISFPARVVWAVLTLPARSGHWLTRVLRTTERPL